MARKPRIYSESGIYHVILRGINREKIFRTTAEKEKLIFIMKKYFSGDYSKPIKKEQGQLYAFCILDNHVHFLLKESKLGISNLMLRIASSYASFFNRRHGRSGYVFESRYTSRPVEGNQYFNNALKYIHNNPVSAGIVNDPKEYPFSSLFFFSSNSTSFLTKRIPKQKAGINKPILECVWPERISDFWVLSKIHEFCERTQTCRTHIQYSSKLLKSIILQLWSIPGITKVQISKFLYISMYKLTKLLALYQASTE